ncbi:MAG: hypothetical protein AAFW47_06625 [Pseudomonadota bacterium]
MTNDANAIDPPPQSVAARPTITSTAPQPELQSITASGIATPAIRPVITSIANPALSSQRPGPDIVGQMGTDGDNSRQSRGVDPRIRDRAEDVAESDLKRPAEMAAGPDDVPGDGPQFARPHDGSLPTEFENFSAAYKFVTDRYGIGFTDQPLYPPQPRPQHSDADLADMLAGALPTFELLSKDHANALRGIIITTERPNFSDDVDRSSVRINPETAGMLMPLGLTALASPIVSLPTPNYLNNFSVDMEHVVLHEIAGHGFATLAIREARDFEQGRRFIARIVGPESPPDVRGVTMDDFIANRFPNDTPRIPLVRLREHFDVKIRTNEFYDTLDATGFRPLMADWKGTLDIYEQLPDGGATRAWGRQNISQYAGLKGETLPEFAVAYFKGWPIENRWPDYEVKIPHLFDRAYGPPSNILLHHYKRVLRGADTSGRITSQTRGEFR